MNELADKLRILLYQNRKAFEKVNALIVYHKYKNKTEWNIFEELDREMEAVNAQLRNGLVQFTLPIFSETTFSRKDKAWIRIAKLQKDMIHDFYYEVFEIKNGYKDVGNGTQRKLEYLDNQAITLINAIESKINFFENNLGI